MCECRCLWRSENGIESFGAGVIGGFPPLMWVLGSKWSFATAVSTLSCWPISPALDCLPFVHGCSGWWSTATHLFLDCSLVFFGEVQTFAF